MTLLGKDANKNQLRLYDNFPAFRGFSDKALDPEALEAVLVASLTFGTAKDKVLLLAPANQETWVLEHLNESAEQVFTHCKTLPDAKKMAYGFGVLFKKIALYSKVLRMPEEPPYWLSFGFTKEDPIPDWMRARLL